MIMESLDYFIVNDSQYVYIYLFILSEHPAYVVKMPPTKRKFSSEESIGICENFLEKTCVVKRRHAFESKIKL